MVEQVSNLKTGVKYKDTLAGRVPIDWEVSAFSEIAEINPKRTLKKRAVYPFVEMAALDSDSHRVKFTRLRKYEGGGTKFQNGDTLFARITPCTENGKTAFIDFLEEKEFGHGSTEFIVLGPKDNVNPKFIYYSTKWDKVRNIAIAKMEGTSGRQRVPSRVFTEDIFIPIPPFPEQKKIAEILTTVDDAIEKTTQIIENAKELKKGLMQKLFTEGIGHTRFKKTKIGKMPERWILGRIDDFVMEFEGGASLKPSDFTNIGTKVLPKLGLVPGGIVSIPEDKQQYCSNEYAEANRNSLVNRDCIIVVLRDLVPSGPNIGLMGKIPNGESYIMAQGVYGFRIDKHKLSEDYLVQLSNSGWYRKIMQKIMVGSTQVHIRNAEFLNVTIPCPPMAEQGHIARSLKEMDAEIEKENAYRFELEQIKRGLMQVLLTGRLRVSLQV